MSTEKKYCSICGCEINGFGHNPYPINNGRCCDACNQKVIEMRLVMNQLSPLIDNMVNAINHKNYGELFAFTYRKHNYAFCIYKGGAKNLVVKVMSDDENGWGVYTNNEILRMCIQNYLDYNHKDKKLGKVKKQEDSWIKINLGWHLQEHINERAGKVA